MLFVVGLYQLSIGVRTYPRKPHFLLILFLVSKSVKSDFFCCFNSCPRSFSTLSRPAPFLSTTRLPLSFNLLRFLFSLLCGCEFLQVLIPFFFYILFCFLAFEALSTAVPTLWRLQSVPCREPFLPIWNSVAFASTRGTSGKSSPAFTLFVLDRRVFERFGQSVIFAGSTMSSANGER
uniref:Uncharacterized protein n=1 Tax=Ixodes ricinus TaxID=34613 RepID=A0A147BBH1_IXORI